MLRFVFKSFLIFLLTLIWLGLSVLGQIRSVSEGRIFSVDQVPKARYALLLGAGVLSGGELSAVLRDRADTVLELYRKGFIERVLISGDNSSRYYNEVVPVRQYLMERGIPQEHIFLDYAGFDTYSSLYRARDIFILHEFIIVTQKFHLPRALYIAHSLGLSVQGAIADKRPYTKASWYEIREFFACVKAIYETLTHARPRFLGKVINLQRDGREWP